MKIKFNENSHYMLLLYYVHSTIRMLVLGWWNHNNKCWYVIKMAKFAYLQFHLAQNFVASVNFSIMHKTLIATAWRHLSSDSIT